MGSEFVARKSSVWAKKSDTKPTLFTSRPFSEPTREENTVNKKELPLEIPPANYIFNKIGFNSSQPAVQRQEDNSDKEQEPDLMSKSDESPVADEEEKISPSLEDENKEEKVNLKTVPEEEEKEETLSPQLEDENKQEDLQLTADEPEKEEDMVSPQLEDENKQEELNKKSIQTKLTVGEPGDKYEQEADTVAAKVVEQINSPKTDKPVQGKVEPVVQPTLMRQGGAAGGTVNRDVEQNIQQARGGGQGLADNVRQPMEQAFGTDFSGVKVHTGGQADVLNRSLNSRAFATGQDIFFKQGEYNPGSRGGQELLAHELTHVVQQGGNALRLQRWVLPTDWLDYIGVGIDLVERAYIELAYEEGEEKDYHRFVNTLFLVIDLVLAALPGAGGGGLAIRGSRQLAIAGWGAIPDSAKLQIATEVARRMGWPVTRATQMIHLFMMSSSNSSGTRSSESSGSGGNSGSSPKTPGGRRLTSHAQESLPRHGFREPYREVDNIIENATRETTQRDGAKVYIRRSGGRRRLYDLVIESEEGIVTAMRNKTPHELRNLGRNHGFNPNP